jgi:hypothetical protein
VASGIDPSRGIILTGSAVEQQRRQAAPAAPERLPPGKVYKLTVPLNGKEYYYPDNYTDPDCILGMSEMGPILSKGYSNAARAPQFTLSVHCTVRFLAVGIIVETVNEPPWWNEVQAHEMANSSGEHRKVEGK